jgi:hypothetical protein
VFAALQDAIIASAPSAAQGDRRNLIMGRRSTKPEAG